VRSTTEPPGERSSEEIGLHLTPPFATAPATSAICSGVDEHRRLAERESDPDRRPYWSGSFGSKSFEPFL
jgi:hypothetical protein